MTWRNLKGLAELTRTGGIRKSLNCQYRLYFVIDKYQSQFAAGTQYAYYHEGDESSFQLVDTSKPQKTAYQKNRQRFNNVRFIMLFHSCVSNVIIRQSKLHESDWFLA